MYRGASERERTFGVDAGRYTGAVRTISLRKAPIDVRTRLAGILAGTQQPTPIRAIRTSLSMWWSLFPVASVLFLGCLGFGAKDSPVHGPFTLLLYAPIVTLLAYALLARVRASAGIGNGLYLLPLDLVEIVGDRATIHPLGELTHVKKENLGLLLTFRNGKAIEVAFGSRPAMREGYASLSHAHELLLQLSYSNDEGAAIASDPFYSLRVDDSWRNASARPPPSPRVRMLLAIALGILGSVGFLALRNHLSVKRASEIPVSWTPPLDPSSQVPAEELARANTPNLAVIATTPDAFLQPYENQYVSELCEKGLLSYGPVMPKGPVPEFVRAALNRGRATGKRAITVSWNAADKSGLAWANQANHDRFFGGVLRALQHAFGEHFSPAVLSIKETTVDADLQINFEARSFAPPDAGRPLAAEFVFHVTLGRTDEAPRREVAKFDLTMPPAKALPPLRESSLFPTTANDPDQRLAARAFDRLYDELYGLFFTGPVRVPLRTANVE